MLAAGVLPAWPAQASRFVEFRIYLDGKLIFVATMGDDGEPDADAVWTRLRQLPLRLPDKIDHARDQGRPADGALPPPFAITADAGNALQATLRGKIKIVNGYSFTRETTSLRLVRSSPTDDEWRVADDEVERLRKPQPPGSQVPNAVRP